MADDATEQMVLRNVLAIPLEKWEPEFGMGASIEGFRTLTAKGARLELTWEHGSDRIWYSLSIDGEHAAGDFASEQGAAPSPPGL